VIQEAPTAKGAELNNPITDSQLYHYSRQILLNGFGLDGQEQLLAGSALQLGVGGLGCACAQYLVAAGIGRLTLVDDDDVEISNLQRQILYTEQSIHRHKVDAAKQRLCKLNSDTEIQAIAARLDDKRLITLARQHSVIIDCSDNLSTRNQLNQVSLATGTPLISGAAIRMEGQITSFIPGTDAPCYQCYSSLFGEQNLSCVESGILAPVVGIIGAMQALEAIKIIVGYGKPLVGKLQIFDALNGEWQSLIIPKRQDCPACQV